MSDVMEYALSANAVRVEGLSARTPLKDRFGLCTPMRIEVIRAAKMTLRRYRTTRALILPRKFIANPYSTMTDPEAPSWPTLRVDQPSFYVQMLNGQVLMQAAYCIPPRAPYRPGGIGQIYAQMCMH